VLFKQRVNEQRHSEISEGQPRPTSHQSLGRVRDVCRSLYRIMCIQRNGHVNAVRDQNGWMVLVGYRQLIQLLDIKGKDTLSHFARSATSFTYSIATLNEGKLAK
jgi:hypothetical protein